MKRTLFNSLTATIVLAAVVSCGKQTPALTKSGLTPESFNSEYNGKPTALYTLTNASGMEVCITNFGGRIVSIMVPDRNGKFIDVVHGFDSIAAYFPENNQTDFGATIGRYANRIGHATFTLDGKTYNLPKNNFDHCLHGGPTGWQYHVFECLEADASHVKLQTVSPDGDNGFPGCITASVTFTLTNDNAIDIKYEATTDAPTVINMTNHSYFNLSGDNTDCTVLDDILYVNASNATPIDSTFLTTGEIVPVAGTPLDFTTPKRAGDVILNTEDEQIRNGRGIDHNWVLDAKRNVSVIAGSVVSPATGIKLEVFTDEPGMQVYSGNFLDGTVTGKSGRVYKQHSAICLETQKYPDTPNKADWPSAVLRPDETYSSHTIFKFSTEK